MWGFFSPLFPTLSPSSHSCNNWVSFFCLSNGYFPMAISVSLCLSLGGFGPRQAAHVQSEWGWWWSTFKLSTSANANIEGEKLKNQRIIESVDLEKITEGHLVQLPAMSRDTLSSISTQNPPALTVGDCRDETPAPLRANCPSAPLTVPSDTF